jgi:hypothetical protein
MVTTSGTTPPKKDKTPTRHDALSVPVVCPCCKQTKTTSEFYRSKFRKSGIVAYCKVCWGQKAQERRKGRKHSVTVSHKKCFKCGHTKPAEEFHSNTSRHDGLATMCKSCGVTYHANRRMNSPYDGFRILWHAIKKRCLRHGLPFSLRYAHIREVWDAQSGKCSLTGIDMTWADGTKNGRAVWNSGSLDRIEPKKGYVEGNVRFVLFCINSMKGESTDDVMLMVARALVNKADGLS